MTQVTGRSLTMEFVTRVDTTLYADSIECVPDASQALVVCGTYQLDETTSTRGGHLILYDISEELTLVEKQRLNLQRGILDMKWSRSLHTLTSPTTSSYLLACATSIGELQVYGIRSEHLLTEVAQADVDNPAILTLSLDWNDCLPERSVDPTTIVCSYSNGELRTWNIDDCQVSLKDHWQAHTYEAWITAFDCWHPKIVFSGSDDATLKGWDTRMLPSPTFTKRFEVGVTSLQFSPHVEHIVAVGSYDDNVTIWDTRSMKNSLVSFNTGGGVFRVKWHPYQPGLLACACMYNGYTLLEFEDDFGAVSSSSSLYDDGHLCYGIDWKRATHQPAGDILVCCSFYDHSCGILSYSSRKKRNIKD